MFNLFVLHLKSTDPELIERQLVQHLSRAPGFFTNVSVVLDLQDVREAAATLDIPALVKMLRKHRLFPTGVRNAAPVQEGIALAAGLGLLSANTGVELKEAAATVLTEKEAADEREDSELSHAPASPADGKQTAAGEPQTRPALTVHKPVRSGQQIYAQASDLILLTSVNVGAEVLADGNIHVYGPLRGRALAGVKGDSAARIFCQSMEAELISIAGNYRVIEEKLPDAMRNKPAQVYLEGERLVIAPL